MTHFAVLMDVVGHDVSSGPFFAFRWVAVCSNRMILDVVASIAIRRMKRDICKDGREKKAVLGKKPLHLFAFRYRLQMINFSHS